MVKKCLRGLTMVVTVLLLAIVIIGSEKEKSPEKEKPAEKEQPKYVGVKQCKMCHMSEKKGNQFGQWQGSKHANAYKTLGTDKAKEIAKKIDKDIDNPQKSERCLRCHITAYGVDAKLITESFKQEDGVQCETCHGPGSDYKPMSTMKDREKAIEKGLIIPDGKMCRTCHNKESPSYKTFCFKRYFKEVTHPDPNQKHKKPECDCEKDKDGKCKDECRDECNKKEESKSDDKEESKDKDKK